MKGRKRSLECEECKHHPTRRTYVKCNSIFKGIAWVCPECNHFTMDSDGKRLI